jgi:hypothetical protein
MICDWGLGMYDDAMCDMRYATDTIIINRISHIVKSQINNP